MIVPAVLPYGEHALLLELDDTWAVIGWAGAIEQAGLDEVVDVVPAARTVLVVAHPGTDLDTLRRRVLGLTPQSYEEVAEQEPVAIAVTYDGPDLADVAAHTRLSEREVVEAHTARPWRVAFGGFAPGFAYLVGGDPRLEVPRRDEPRTRVPAGAVGLAGEFSGVYPRESPGGWQLIGSTTVRLWDEERTPPALLRPGAWVRFERSDT